MKKFLSVLLCVVIGASCVSLLGGCQNRSGILKIYNWGEYMDPDIIPIFEAWYKENTGKKIKVQYNEYETNEDMFTQIYRKKKDYDLVCPSEYMLARMAKANLLLEVDADTKKAVAQNVSASVNNLLSAAFDGDYMKYTVPFVWGTMGVLYNSKTPGLNDEAVSHWEILWNSDYNNKIYMKDSVRDSYTIAMINYYKDELLSLIETDEQGNPVYGDAYRAKLESILYQINNNEIAKAKTLLMQQKSLVRAYEVDSAKDDMLNDLNGSKGYLGVFWSCDAGYVMNLSEADANLNLRYVVPEEGSNVWVDSFVIPKYAKNTEAANLFMQFVCNYDKFNTENNCNLDTEEYADIAFLNMSYIGSTTCVESSMQAYKDYLTWLNEAETEDDLKDDEGNIDPYDRTSWNNLKNAPEEFFDMYISMLFPGDEILNRCAIMRDVEEFNSALDEMWLDVRVN